MAPNVNKKKIYIYIKYIQIYFKYFSKIILICFIKIFLKYMYTYVHIFKKYFDKIYQNDF